MGRGPGANLPNNGANNIANGNNNNSINIINNQNSSGGGNSLVRANTTPPSATSANGLPLTLIAELRPSMPAEPRRVYETQLLSTFLAADRTGSVLLVLWGEEGALLRNGDMIRVQGGEAKMYKGFIQLTTAKYGKYKKIGEDTMVFFEKPNWSECEWVHDQQNKAAPMIPINPITKMPMVPNGAQPMMPNAVPPMMPGGNIQQQRNMQGNNMQPAINPAFRGDQRQGPRPFNQNGGFPMAGPPGQGPAGFHNKGNFGGPGGGPGNQMQQQQQQLGANVAPIGPVGGPSGNRPHHGSYQNHGNQNQNPNQGAGGSGPPNNHHPSAGRLPKHNKHKVHRDLDAPDSYPSPRTGLNNGVDEFARDMKLVAQGGVGLGMGQGNQGGGAGSAGSGHMRKKPKVETD
ncbi:hypothetical protein BGZ54_006476 [Gamsiella multidivaricata]|nr:hypothetical protein BGZ54_006476 [Gamsiella multidivaricata]